MEAKDVRVPLDVPAERREIYIKNYLRMTQNSGRLMLFAGDQKVEHLNKDFYGEGVAPDDQNPKHLFEIASKGRIGAFATQLGLIARYGMDYKNIPYVVKLNSKTNLVPTSQHDPISRRLMGVDPLMEFSRNSGLNIVGIGYTIYLGSEYEAEMFQEAAALIYNAHRYGMLAIVWGYIRGKAVTDEKDPHVIAGAAGVAACLGADFVKVNYPEKEGVNGAEALKEAVQAAGRTQLVCAGGENTDAKTFLQTLYDQINISGASGSATGRNIHQRPLDEAIKLCNAISAITVDNKNVDEAIALLKF